MLQSATPAPSAAGVPDVLPVVMPDVPVVPEMLPAPRPELTLPALLPADLPAEGRAVLAAALAGPVPGPRRERGDLLHAGTGMCWDEEECARLLGFLDQVDDTRDRRGRLYPLRYLLALPLVAGMAGDDETDAAAEWAASAPDDLLVRLGAPRDRSGGRGGRTPSPSAGSSATSTRSPMTMRCADGRRPVPARSGLACAATCGSTAKRCTAPAAAAAPRCCCPGSGTTAPPPPSSR